MERVRALLPLLLLAGCAEPEPETPTPVPANKRIAAHLADGGGVIAFRVDTPERPRCRRVVSAWSILSNGRFGKVFVQRESMRSTDRIGDPVLQIVEVPVSGTYGLRFLGCRDISGQLVGLERTLGVVDVRAGEVTSAGRFRLPGLPSDAFDIDRREGPENRELVESWLPGTTVTSQLMESVDTVLDQEQIAILNEARDGAARETVRQETYYEMYSELLAYYRIRKAEFERIDRMSRAKGLPLDSMEYRAALNATRYIRAVVAKVPTLEEAGVPIPERFRELRDAATTVEAAANVVQAERTRLLAIMDRYRPDTFDMPSPDLDALDRLLPPVTAADIKSLP